MLKSFTIKNEHDIDGNPYDNTRFLFIQPQLPNENYQIFNTYIVLTDNFLCSNCNYFVRLEIGPGGTSVSFEGVVNFYQKDTGTGTEQVTYWERIGDNYIANGSGISLNIKPGQSPFVYYIAPNYGRKRVEGYFVHGTEGNILIDNFVALTFTQTNIPVPKIL